jgi:gamma-glutamyl:cysteine ligase YbdK (ATP-grasp superfamily)
MPTRRLLRPSGHVAILRGRVIDLPAGSREVFAIATVASAALLLRNGDGGMPAKVMKVAGTLVSLGAFVGLLRAYRVPATARLEQHAQKPKSRRRTDSLRSSPRTGDLE